MTLNEAIQKFEDLGLLKEYFIVRVDVKSSDTEVSQFLFACEMPVSEARYFFGNLIFITSSLTTSGEDDKYAELVLLVAKRRETNE